jgi:alpha-methylacyl-CoA racemase
MARKSSALSGSGLTRGRPSIQLDLKSPESVQIIRDLARTADAIIEGFRPGVMERLGLGPEVLLADNPRLAYGRMTGWGQDGPLANAPGHDINYLSIGGPLHAIGPANGIPVPPLNLVGDYGGGGAMLAFGLVAAILGALRTGRGQVIDCAMSEGAALLMAQIWGLFGRGLWSDTRGANMLDGGAHFYGVYRCADGGFVSVGAIEPPFYAALRQLAGIDDPAFEAQLERAQWPALREKLEAIFVSRPRDEWCALLEGTDACVSPVLGFTEAPDHPQNRSRASFVEHEGVLQPAPVPRFGGTPGSIRYVDENELAERILLPLGYGADTLAALRRAGTLA